MILENFYKAQIVKQDIVDFEFYSMDVFNRCEKSNDVLPAMTRSTVNTAIRKLEKEGVLYLTKGTGNTALVAYLLYTR